MVKIMAGDDIQQGRLKVKVRFDYKGETKPGRVFFRGKNTEQVAEETREQKVSLLRNVPFQGITIEDIDLSADVYTVHDDVSDMTVAYAPVMITLSSDTIEDMLRFIIRDEFRKVEVIEPEELFLTSFEVERLLFKMNEEMRNYRYQLERKLAGK